VGYLIITVHLEKSIRVLLKFHNQGFKVFFVEHHDIKSFRTIFFML